MSDHHSMIKEQPESVPSPSVHVGRTAQLRARVNGLKHKFTTRDGWLGDYNYAWLCMPTLPFAVGGRRRKTMPPFYALDSDLPTLLALTCGLQHALAMLAGLITPPIIFANALSLDAETSAYMISASLIGCGESCFPELKLFASVLTSFQGFSAWCRCPDCICSKTTILVPVSSASSAQALRH